MRSQIDIKQDNVGLFVRVLGEVLWPDEVPWLVAAPGVAGRWKAESP